MKKVDTKGFTLIEVMLAITILSIVIASGYKIIVGISVFMNSQKNITYNMSTANLVNKYLTKDIEKSKSISDIEIISDTSYKYIISQQDRIIEYIVENNINKNKRTYNLIRKEDLSEIVIIENQKTYNDFPFVINKTQNNTVYQVVVNYKEDKKEKQYAMNISSRLESYLEDNNASASQEIYIPSMPKQVYLDTSYVAFWKSNKEFNKTKKVGVWIDESNLVGISKKDISPISAIIKTGNNKYLEYAYIENIKTEGVKSKISTDNIMIYVSNGAKLDNFSIHSKDNNTKIEVLDSNNNSIGNENITLAGNNTEGTWYSCKVNGKLNLFEVNGNLSIDKQNVSTAFILIVLGNEFK